MKENNFKTSLHVDVPKLNNYQFYNATKTDLLLSKLGLFPLPKNVQARLSQNNKYLNINIKNSPDEKHLLFQFPIVEQDLSTLKNREDYHDLINRYHLYTNDYVNEIKDYSIREREYLTNRFPGLVFNIKIRIKSFDSYVRKLNDNLLNGKTPYINDIIAERIIISEYKGSSNEAVLKDMCNNIAQALYDFRIETNFRMKKNLAPNTANSNKDYISKDYIEHPKPNGYESIHILMEHKDNNDFTYETQIRTFDMENMSKTCGEIAHTKYKPRILNDLSTNRVPTYYEVTSFKDEFNNPIILEVPLNNRFYHFYNSEKNDHSNPNNIEKVPITYNKFRAEQYELENLLGIKFKELREKLRILDKENNRNMIEFYDLLDNKKLER